MGCDAIRFALMIEARWPVLAEHLFYFALARLLDQYIL